MINKTILFVSTGLGTGGVAKMVHHIAGVLATEFKKVVAVTTSDNLVRQNNGVQYLDPLDEQNEGVIGHYHTMKAVRRVIKNVRPDIVISFTTNIAFCTRIATLGMKNITVISAERGDPYSLSFKWKVLVPWAFRHSDWCFFQLEHARDYYGAKVLNKSFVIPNPAFFEGQKGIHHCERNTITSVGRFVREKGFDYLIDAFDLVHQKYPNYKLVLYGDGPLREEYESQVKRLGLDSYVLFPGKTNNVVNSLKSEGIFVLSSRYEGMPNVLIEALMVGIPTVSSDCNPGGPRFLTNNGKRGLLFDVGNVKDMAECIIRLIEDRQLYCDFEKRGPEIAEILRPEIIDKQWIDAFKYINSKI